MIGFREFLMSNGINRVNSKQRRVAPFLRKVQLACLRHFVVLFGSPFVITGVQAPNL